MESLLDNMNILNAGIVTLQETHFSKKGKFNDKLSEFEVFEAIRRKVKGGTAIIVHKSLKPVLIEEYADEFELIVVEVKLGSKHVRIISGYGPQENWTKENRMPFFNALEQEVNKAKLNNKAVIIQMDANSKLGPKVIKGDPHNESENGKLLNDIINRNALVVINAQEKKCSGKITRMRSTGRVEEKSIIDFVIACDEGAEIIESMIIDEERKFVLARFTKTKNNSKVKESDHNSIITNVKARWDKTDVPKRQESYNFKNKESLQKFKEMTSEGHFLSEVFNDENKDIEVKTKQFLKRLKFVITKCFKKTRAKGQKKNQQLERLFEKRRELKNKKDERSTKELEKVEEMLSVQCAEQNFRLVKEACEGLACENGGVNLPKMWKLKKQLTRAHADPPSAMLDDHGNVVTESEGIEKLVIKRYADRLQALEIKPELKLHQMQRESLCDKRLETARENKTPEWTEKELNIVLKQLKNNKSKDPLDLPNEIFKPEHIGNDLKQGLLRLMNQIKTQQKIPSVLKKCNITSLYKNKGSKKDFENYRGIFRVVALRSILDKLIYNDEYPVIDENMTDSNVGARQERNIRDNIFVINAVMNEIVKKKLKGIDIQVFDVYKCFDKLWAKECLNDLYENGFDNDKLPLLYEANVNAQVAVKTATGITKRTPVSDVVMQGTVWGSIMCTSTMDKLGKQAYASPENLYKYKGVPIPPLGMVDDIVSVSSVENTEKINSLINTFIEHKKLKLSETKCSRIHIGKDHEQCPVLKVHDSKMKESEKEKYLGDFITKDGKNQATIEDRKSKAKGAIAEILAMLEEIPFGSHRYEVAIKLRESILLSRILCNSEVWHAVTAANIVTLEKLDEGFLRSILRGHSKTPKEMLYLETGTVPIRWILPQRRINYLKHLLTRNKKELIRKVFEAQNENPTAGDFVTLVNKDLVKFELTQEKIMGMTKQQVKRELRRKAQKFAFCELYQKTQQSSKVKEIKYTELKMQDYLKSDKMNKNEKNMLFAIRTKCVKGVKSNFKNLHKVCLHCPMQCNKESPELDTQEHVLKCNALGGSDTEVDFMHASTVDQSYMTQQFCKLMTKREQVLEGAESSTSCCCLPGAILDHCTQPGAAVMHNV